MNWILLFLGVLTLLIVVKLIVILEVKKVSQTIVNEIKHIILMIPLGIAIVTLIVYIPYQTWILFGRPEGFEIIYILGSSGILTTILCFGYYYKLKLKIQKINNG